MAFGFHFMERNLYYENRIGSFTRLFGACFEEIFWNSKEKELKRGMRFH